MMESLRKTSNSKLDCLHPVWMERKNIRKLRREGINSRVFSPLQWKLHECTSLHWPSLFVNPNQILESAGVWGHLSPHVFQGKIYVNALISESKPLFWKNETWRVETAARSDRTACRNHAGDMKIPETSQHFVLMQVNGRTVPCFILSDLVPLAKSDRPCDWTWGSNHLKTEPVQIKVRDRKK